MTRKFVLLPSSSWRVTFLGFLLLLGFHANLLRLNSTGLGPVGEAEIDGARTLIFPGDTFKGQCRLDPTQLQRVDLESQTMEREPACHIIRESCRRCACSLYE